MAGRKGEKHWRDALMIAVNETREGDPEGRRNLRVIADVVVNLALAGDMQAIKEIGDRMDGKAPQGVELSGPDGGAVQMEDVSPRDILADRVARLAARLGADEGNGGAD
jgi:hypothetical protein